MTIPRKFPAKYVFVRIGMCSRYAYNTIDRWTKNVPPRFGEDRTAGFAAWVPWQPPRGHPRRKPFTERRPSALGWDEWLRGEKKLCAQMREDLRKGEETEIGGPNRSILDTIGRRRLYLIVWRAIPLPWRIAGFPYGVIVYRRLFVASDTLPYLRAMHAKEFHSSRLFRLLRPRFRKVEHQLRAYGFQDDGTLRPLRKHA